MRDGASDPSNGFEAGTSTEEEAHPPSSGSEGLQYVGCAEKAEEDAEDDTRRKRGLITIVRIWHRNIRGARRN